jgi:hypothetical protein
LRAASKIGTNKSVSLERVIRDLAASKDFDRIKKIIQQLCNEYAYAVHQPHARNGGLIGLAAAAIALGPVCLSNYAAAEVTNSIYRIWQDIWMKLCPQYLLASQTKTQEFGIMLVKACITLPR